MCPEAHGGGLQSLAVTTVFDTCVTMVVMLRRNCRTASNPDLQQWKNNMMLLPFGHVLGGNARPNLTCLKAYSGARGNSSVEHVVALPRSLWISCDSIKLKGK